MQDGTWKGGGNATFGLKEQGVGLGKVSSKVPQGDLDKVEAIEQEIATGKIGTSRRRWARAESNVSFRAKTGSDPGHGSKGRVRALSRSGSLTTPTGRAKEGDRCQLTEGQAAFLHEEPNLAIVAALREDGTPHQTPVWVDWDGEQVLLNLNNFRAKLDHLRHDPRVSVLVLDRNDPFRWIAIDGTVDEITTDGADAHMVRQAVVYLGRETYTRDAGEERILVKIAPERVEVHNVE